VTEITIKVDGRNITLDTNSIDYIQSYENYVKVFTAQRIYVVSTTTQEILAGLSSNTFIGSSARVQGLPLSMTMGNFTATESGTVFRWVSFQ
jgi:hypothetical protein